MINVLIADDHAFVRHTLVDLLGQSTDLRVVAECADGDEVLEAALNTRPDVALLDLAMPRRSGLSAARELLASAPSVRVVILTASLDPAAVREARDVGVAGYLLKGEEPDELCRHIRRVAEGGTAWSAAASAALETGSRPPETLAPYT